MYVCSALTKKTFRVCYRLKKYRSECTECHSYLQSNRPDTAAKNNQNIPWGLQALELSNAWLALLIRFLMECQWIGCDDPDANYANDCT